MCFHRLSMRLAGGLALPLALAMLDSAPVRAGVDSWTPFGPGDGRLVSVAASSRGDLFAIAAFGDLAEVWQLPAGAATWGWRNNGLGRPRVAALAVHPTLPDRLWALTAEPVARLFRSVDAGGSWLLVGPVPADFTLGSLWAVPYRGSVVLFAAGGGASPPRLLRSADGGVTWSQLPDVLGPLAAAIDQPGVVYAAAGFPGIDPGLARSTDGGKTFRRVGIQVHHNDGLWALHVTRGRSPLVFASFGSGLFRSADGRRFEPVGLYGGPTKVASDPRDSRLVYATNATGFYTSTRAGRKGSFHIVVSFLGGPSTGPVAEPTALIVPPFGPLFLSAGELRGTSFGYMSERGLVGFGASEVRVAPPRPSLVALRQYTQCAPQCDLRTYVSSDAGFSFLRRGWVAPPHFFVDIRDLAFDPESAPRWLELGAGVGLVDATGLHLLQPTVLNTPPTTVEIAGSGALVVGAGGGVLVSRDNGASWTTTLGNPQPFPATNAVDLRTDAGAADRLLALVVQLATVDPPAPAKLLAYRSVDVAAHWSPVLPAVAGLLDVEPVPGSPTGLLALFAVAGGSELRRSDDGGVTSSSVHTFTAAEEVSDVVVDAVAADVLYAASANGLLRSRDGGATWESTPGTFDAWGSYRGKLQRLWVHPTERGHVFAAPADGGLFENRLSD